MSDHSVPEDLLSDIHLKRVTLEDAFSGNTTLDGSFVFLPSGTVIDGKYELLNGIGSGGSSAVYRARHLSLDKIVAVKILHASSRNARALARFQNEARAAYRLRHQNVVAVTDYGVTQNGLPYLVMDYAEGISLTQFLKKNGTLTLDQFVKLFSQLCEGLEHAHNSHIVHRDIKTSNIILTDSSFQPGSIKLVDFGIARLLSDCDAQQRLTQTGEIFGSPYYMSPEQCYGKDVNTRSDMYSLGCVMFEALTGKVPFEGETALHTLMLHCSAPIPRLEGISTTEFAHSKLDEIVTRTLQKEQSARFSDIGELKAAIANLSEWPRVPKVAHSRSPQIKRNWFIQVTTTIMMSLGLSLSAYGAWLVQADERGIEHLRTVLFEQEHNRFSEMINAADSLNEMGSVPIALSKAKESASFAKLWFGPNSMQHATALDTVGRCYVQLANIGSASANGNATSASAKAVECLLAAVAIADNHGAEMHRQQADYRFHLARAFLYARDAESARQTWQEGMLKLQRKLNPLKQKERDLLCLYRDILQSDDEPEAAQRMSAWLKATSKPAARAER